MNNVTIPSPIPYQPARTHIDLFSALLRAKQAFGAQKVIIVDGDERELSYKDIIRAAFGLGAALKKAHRGVNPSASCCPPAPARSSPSMR